MLKFGEVLFKPFFQFLQLQAPLQQLEHALHPWSSYVILPLFALANAGVHFDPSGLGQVVLHPITIAVVLGLFIGKPVGITLFSLLSVCLGLADLPSGVQWSSLFGAGIWGGIGFTMSLFVSVLAFVHPEQIESAKLGILIGSLLSGVMGALILRKVLTKSAMEKLKD